MSRADQLARPHLAPDPADLARLVAGAHHNPHGILGAHEYGDHTVIRAFRPHAAEVVALVGDDRFPLQHIDSGLFAVALPFVDLIDYRLRSATSGGDAVHRRRRLPLPAHAGRSRPAPVRRGPPRAAVGSPWRPPPLVHHRRRRGRRGVVRGVGAQRQGRQPDRRVQRLERQRGADAGAGLVGCLGVVLARFPASTACTSSACTAPTASSPTAPTRWRSPPRCRRRPHRG